MASIDTRPETAAGLRALLEEIIDYAGMFPPASLPIEDAVKKFSEYRHSDEAWMLARCIISAGRLEELERHAELFKLRPPFRFSILFPEDGEDFVAALERELKEVRRFSDRHRHDVSFDQIETRLPRSYIDTDVVNVRRFLNSVDDILEKLDLQELDFFVEIPMDEYLRQTLPILTGAISLFNRDRTKPNFGRAGLKIRTGGTDAAVFPSAEEVAYVVASCRNAGVGFKATAGLHHPIRRFDEGMGTNMHGFLNLFCGAVLAAAHELDEEGIASILRDDEPSHFQFTSEGLEWTHLSAPQSAIERVRSERAVSFGSCSFQEPVDDLKALDLL